MMDDLCSMSSTVDFTAPAECDGAAICPVQLTAARGQEERVRAVRVGLTAAHQRLTRRQRLIERAVSSLRRPERSPLSGPGDSCSERLQLLADPPVAAQLLWQCMTDGGSCWLLGVRVAETGSSGPRSATDRAQSADQIGTPSLLVCCDRPLSYTCLRATLPLRPSALLHAPPSTASALPFLICVRIDVSDWTDVRSVRLLLSGLMPPGDSYQLSVGRFTLSPSDRLTMSAQPSLLSPASGDVSECSATIATLWAQCDEWWCARIASAAAASHLSTQLVRHGFTAVDKEQLFWTHPLLQHALHGVLLASLDEVQGALASVNEVQGALASVDEVQGALASVDEVQGALASVDEVQGALASVDEVQGALAVWTRNRAQLALLQHLLSSLLSPIDQWRPLSSQHDSQADTSVSGAVDSLRSALDSQCSLIGSRLSSVTQPRAALRRADTVIEGSAYRRWRHLLYDAEVRTARAATQLMGVTSHHD